MGNGESSYRRFLDGDESAFDEVLDLYHDNLIFFINRFVHNLTVSEDLAAEAFLDLIIHKKRYDFQTSLKTYLFLIGKCRAIDYLRHNAKQQQNSEVFIENEQDYNSLEEKVISNERKQIVNKAIQQLNDDYRNAIYLIYFEELTYKEAAMIMKKTTKQVENLVYRAKNALRPILEEEGICL